MKSPALVLLILSLFSCQNTPTSPLPSPKLMANDVFPAAGGQDLTGAERRFPADLKAKKNVVIVAFQRWHQDEVDVWFKALETQIRADPDIEYCELPTLAPMGSLREWFLFKGMQSGIPDPWMRERVVTLHLDKKAFNLALGIPDENHVSVFIVAAGGRILGKVHGACNGKLLLQIQTLLQGSP
jgi:hypothetical protein